MQSGPSPSSTDVESASRLLRRGLAEASLEMSGAEPGSEDFIAAYRRSCRLRSLYRSLLETRDVSPEVWSLVA